MSETGATRQGRDLIKAWQDAVDRETRARHEETDALNNERSARKALGDWLMPSDAKPGETFSIWERDRYGNEVMFEVKHNGSGQIPDIKTRARR
ncbi:hypothetical protein [Bradyrhizobium sp. SZCCHNRI2007]|uniref:hypothetical protein n=1 Tax=Bradyrhizobium sp. SZCCHNRI2007 TaxID=3057281 RepID=UPI0028ECDB76|nr:hypothetical protein [Bradyrhizobium sp. SZCCHNRI2007]